MRAGFAAFCCLALCVIEMKAYDMALAERGNKNNATVTEASGHVDGH